MSPETRKLHQQAPRPVGEGFGRGLDKLRSDKTQALSRLGKDTFVKILSCFNRLWFLNITMIPQTFPMFLYQRNIYKNEENHVVDVVCS